MRRLVIADDDAEARFNRALSPLPLDGVISKASPLDVLQDALFTSLIAPGGQRSVQTIFGNFTRIVAFSPTERGRFCVSCRTATHRREIAVQLERNIKTIRAHKFNVMSKLGVSSDAGYSMRRIFCYICAPEMVPRPASGIARAAPCLFGELGPHVIGTSPTQSPMSVQPFGVMRTALCVCLRQAILRYTLQRCRTTRQRVLQPERTYAADRMSGLH